MFQAKLQPYSNQLLLEIRKMCKKNRIFCQKICFIDYLFRYSIEPDVKNQIRILVRTGIQICNIHHSQDDMWHTRDDFKAAMKSLVISYIKLMGIGADILVKDAEIMKGWFFFTYKYKEFIYRMIE